MNKNNKNPKQKPKTNQKPFLHDHLVKEVYSQPKYCLDILELVFSPPEMDLFNLNTLKTEATTFVEKQWKEQRMDLLISARSKDSGKKDSAKKDPAKKNSAKWAKVLFLLEHKSQNDPEVMRQFLSYQNGIYQKIRDPVIPILIDQSNNRSLKGPKDFHSYLHKVHPKLWEFFKGNVLNFAPRVLHIQSLDIKKRAGHLTTHPILYILQSIWRLDKDVVRELFQIGCNLSVTERKFLIDRAVDYVRQYDPYFSWDIVREIERSVVKEEDRIMPPLQYSLEEARQEGLKKGVQQGIQRGIERGIEQGVQQGIQRGIEQGVQQGQKDLILKLLEGGLDVESVCKYTGFSKSELQKLKNGS